MKQIITIFIAVTLLWTTTHVLTNLRFPCLPEQQDAPISDEKSTTVAELGVLSKVAAPGSDSSTPIGQVTEPSPKETFNLVNAPAADRDLDGLTVDLAYNLNVPSNWWDGIDTNPSYSTLMMSLHGKDIWKDDRLLPHLDWLGIKADTQGIYGSPLKGKIHDLLRQYKPKIFLEVGVFRGATSVGMAKFFEREEGFEDSYVLSMDTWLVDLAYAWNGMKSHHPPIGEEYFNDNRISGGNQMYFRFLANCLATNTTGRIIPIQTASLNGAMALLSHGVRPDFMYIDASHANPGMRNYCTFHSNKLVHVYFTNSKL